MMKAQVVEEKVEEDDDEDMEPIDLDAENEAMDAGTNIFASGNYIAVDVDTVEEKVDSLCKVRKYDLCINYDFFHRTPRLWLLGYSESGQLLSQEQMFEDIMGDYANKTVTFEEHPLLPTKWLSIHPCNHAKVMKKIIDQ